ncbi:MAG: thioesterase family protein [Deltaproteobacteria bacterium]|nr:thioesterase family protein [Deltaproteobacteria bacterium]
MWTAGEQMRVGPILASTGARFKAPVTYPDTLLAGARMTNLGRDRFRMEYALYSGALKRIAAMGESLVVAYDYTKNEKADVPGAWIEGFVRVEGAKPPAFA